MGFLFGVQPDSCSCGVAFDECEHGCTVRYRSLRTGATDDHVLWFSATDLETGITVKADEIPGFPGVMSQKKAAGDAGRQRLYDKLVEAVKEFT